MLSRLWYLVLAAALGVSIAGAFLNKSAASREAEFQLREQLRRDRVEAELWLRLDARLRLDALASLAIEPEVRQTLRSSSGLDGTPGISARKRLSNKLNALNEALEEGQGDMVFAVDAEGDVVATLDRNDMRTQKLDKMPLVQDALRGFMRDDVWVFNGTAFRMAARPVFDGGRYVGAIIHGMQMGDDLARRLGEKLPNATIAFFYEGEVIGAHTGGTEAPTRSEVKARLAEFGPEADPDKVIELDERSLGVASPIRGGAAHAGVGYFIGRHGSTVGLGGLFANTFSEDVASLPWSAVVGIPLALLMVGLLLLYLEHDKAVRILGKSSASLAKQETKGLPAGELRRQYRKIAENVNEALRAGVGFTQGAEVRGSVDLDNMLEATRAGVDTGYFGFAQEPATARQAVVPEEEPPTVAAEGQTDGPATTPPRETPTARPKRTSPSTGARAHSSMPPAPTPRHRQPTGAQNARDLTPAPDDPPTRPRAIVDEYAPYDDPEESTQIKHVPQELLEQFEGEDAHFREVFDEFLQTQKDCGGSVAGLTFDKFVKKLHAAQDQVMKRHNAPSVRFTVYVKEGRAALKASPIKA